MPVLPALVHLPEEQEIVAATAFPQTTRRATSQKGTNPHLLRSTAHESSSWRLFSAEPLRFLQRVSSCSSLLRTSLAVVSPGCSAWHTATAISFHRNQPSRGSCLHTRLQHRAFLPCFPWTTQIVRALLASSESWAEQPAGRQAASWVTAADEREVFPILRQTTQRSFRGQACELPNAGGLREWPFNGNLKL